MSPLLNASEIYERAREARRLSSPCRLCPRRCGVNRPSGERGYCGAGPQPSVVAVLPHFGEEPPLIVGGGAGTIFFTRCNLRCVYCQNHQISQGDVGETLTVAALAEKMMGLMEAECSNLEPVSPSHQLPAFLEALAYMAERGPLPPVVYNTNSYETPETLDVLNGLVDVYLPDIKYALNDYAALYSDASDYVETARAAILQMHSQVGNLVVDLEGRAVRGTILRHLILPGGISGTEATLRWIKENLPDTVTISIMAQYSPLNRASEFPPLNRKITEVEYDQAVDLAWDLGFENVFVQDLEAGEVGIPDFEDKKPFDWSGTRIDGQENPI